MKKLIVGLMIASSVLLLPSVARAEQKCSGAESLKLYSAPASVPDLVKAKFGLTLKSCVFGDQKVLFLTKDQATEGKAKEIAAYLSGKRIGVNSRTGPGFGY